MTEITPFPENNYETVLLDRPFRSGLFSREIQIAVYRTVFRGFPRGGDPPPAQRNSSCLPAVSANS